MAESIESFVNKLQAEGIDAGKEAAEKIKKEARREAEKIIADAKAEAEKILSKAKNDADQQLSRGQTELELAVRDAILKLRESLGRALSAMFIQRVEKQFSDPGYLGEIVREVIMAYVKADAGKESRIEINLSKETREKLNDRALKDLFQNLGDEKDKLGLQATLTKAGFEYRIQGATVEVSPEAVSELMSQMLSPALEKVLHKAIGKEGKRPSKDNPIDKGGETVHSVSDTSDSH